jgi:molybdopterin-guanine dinucleotide biosynthesis protein A
MKSKPEKISLEICILAGGLSSRMGRDKSKLRLAGKSLLGHVRQSAATLKKPVRIIRRDCVERCGPIGGIFTALKTTRADVVLFLACDMPKVSETLLRELIGKLNSAAKPVFTWSERAAGFPFLLPKTMLPLVEEMIGAQEFSLQKLAAKTRAEKFLPAKKFQNDLFNVNTPEDFGKLI